MSASEILYPKYTKKAIYICNYNIILYDNFLYTPIIALANGTSIVTM